MAKPNPLSQGLNQTRPAPAAVPASEHAAVPTTTKPRAARSVPPARMGRVLIGGHFAPEVQMQLKMLAAQERTTMQQLVAEGINAVFASRHKPQIATLSPHQADT